MTAAVAEDSGRVGPYRVIQPIGAGGSARIDLARIDRAYGFQRHVVLKRPLEHLRSDPGVAASLRREARIGGRLRHPNLVAVLDAGIHDGYDYLALEYVHGAALRAVMQGDAPGQVRELPLGVTLAIVSDAARGMHEAHELTGDDGAPLGLVHRDVSPGNLLIGLDGTVKLADFGIAKETRVSTLSGSMHGTVTYMAPEQCQGHAFDRRADVFSLGVILYELVTGVRLFWADNDVASLHRVLSGAVPRPRELKPQIPGALEELVMTAVAYAPERRFATALELATAVERYAATAGEALGARWIARAMEAIGGPRPVPWLAAAPAAEVTPTPSGEQSLVDLIAASGADEPVEAGFGDAGDGDAGGDDAAQPLALAEAAAGDPPARPPRTTGAPVDLDEPVAPALPRRRRVWLAAVLATAAIGAGIAAAIVMPPGTDVPASAARRGVGTPTASPAGRGAEPPVGSTTRAAAAPAAIPTAGPQAAAAAPPASPPATTPPASVPSPTRELVEQPAGAPQGSTAGATEAAHGRERPSIAGTKRKRPASRPARVPAEAARDARPEAAAASVPASVAASAAASGAAAAPGAGPGRPAPPPSNVEWKPTLLLPTDGSDGKRR